MGKRQTSDKEPEAELDRTDEAMKAAQEYADDLRAIIEAAQRTANSLHVPCNPSEHPTLAEDDDDDAPGRQ